MFWFGAHMDADSGSVGNILHLGHKLLELRRPCEVEWICSGGDDEIGVFKGVAGVGLFVLFKRELIEGDGYFARHRFARPVEAFEGYC